MSDDSRIQRERSLRAAILNGDESAWRALYDMTYEPLRAFILWKLSGRPIAVEETLQEVWLTAVRKIRSFDPFQAPFVDWVKGVALNVIRNSCRKLRLQPLSNSDLESLEGIGQTISGDLDRTDTSIQINTILNALPANYAAVLQAKYLEQRTVCEIARTWNQTEKGIESLLTRARQAFRIQFEKEQGYV